MRRIAKYGLLLNVLVIVGINIDLFLLDDINLYWLWVILAVIFGGSHIWYVATEKERIKAERSAQ